MGVNLTKEVRGKLKEDIKNAQDAAAAAAAEGPKAEEDKNDCDSVKNKNLKDVAAILDAFVNEKQANIPAIFNRMSDPKIIEIKTKLQGRKIEVNEKCNNYYSWGTWGR